MPEEKKEVQDLKEAETTEGKQSDPKETPQKEDKTSDVSEDIQNPEAKAEDVAAILKDEGTLADGTSSDKDISIKHQKFTELNDKAKLYDEFSPLLKKLQDNPEAVETLTKGKDEEGKDETLGQRVHRLEQEGITKKRNVMQTTISNAVDTWSDFRQHWTAMKPIVAALESQGISYPEAVQRAYFSVNPDAAQKEARLISQAEASSQQNSLGVMHSSGGSQGKKITDGGGDSYNMTQEDKTMATQLGIDPKLYQKHSNFLKQQGLDQL